MATTGPCRPHPRYPHAPGNGGSEPCRPRIAHEGDRRCARRQRMDDQPSAEHLPETPGSLPCRRRGSIGRTAVAGFPVGRTFSCPPASCPCSTSVAVELRLWRLSAFAVRASDLAPCPYASNDVENALRRAEKSPKLRKLRDTATSGRSCRVGGMICRAGHGSHGARFGCLARGESACGCQPRRQSERVRGQRNSTGPIRHPGARGNDMIETRSSSSRHPRLPGVLRQSRGARPSGRGRLARPHRPTLPGVDGVHGAGTCGRLPVRELPQGQPEAPQRNSGKLPRTAPAWASPCEKEMRPAVLAQVPNVMAYVPNMYRRKSGHWVE